MVEKAAPKLLGMETFGERLDYAIRHAGVTREFLAGKLDISVQAVSKLLTGKSNAMTAYNTAEAAVLLGVNWYWLATGKGEPVTAPQPTEPAEQDARHWRELARWLSSQDGAERLRPRQFLRIVDFLAVNPAPPPGRDQAQYARELMDVASIT